MYRKGRYWYATLRGGRQVYLGRNRETAEKKLEQLLSRSKPVLEVVREYLKAVEGTHSQSSWNNRRYLLPGVARDLGYPKIDTVTSDNILAYYKAQRAKNEKISVHSKIAVVASFFAWAVPRYVPKSPFHGLPCWKSVNKPRNDCLTDEQVDLLLELANREKRRFPNNRFRDRSIFGLGLLAGLRREEIAALKWGDIDFNRGVVHVREGKGGRYRAVPIGRRLREILKDHREHRLGAHVVTCRLGQQLRSQSLQRIMKSTREIWGADSTATSCGTRSRSGSSIEGRTSERSSSSSAMR